MNRFINRPRKLRGHTYLTRRFHAARVICVAFVASTLCPLLPPKLTVKANEDRGLCVARLAGGTITCSVGHVSPVDMSQIMPSPPVGSLQKVTSPSLIALITMQSSQLAIHLARARAA